MVADRNSLQRQLTSVAAAHEAETRQLHSDRTGLQVRRHEPLDTLEVTAFQHFRPFIRAPWVDTTSRSSK